MSNIGGKMVKMIAAGGSYSMALTTDSSIFGWGAVANNSAGGVIGVGDGGNYYSSTPVMLTNSVYAGKTISSISASFTNAMALASDGTIYSFGDNSYYQTGNFSSTAKVLTLSQNNGIAQTPALISGEKYTSIQQGTGVSFAATSYGRYDRFASINLHL
jgi:alpha-tubulin suppressor-like RCC1 family protein